MKNVKYNFAFPDFIFKFNPLHKIVYKIDFMHSKAS